MPNIVIRPNRSGTESLMEFTGSNVNPMELRTDASGLKLLAPATPGGDSFYDIDFILSGSFAQGAYTRAVGDFSHAEGTSTIAEGLYSHAEGLSTKAYGNYSHAGGLYTVASGSGQVVFGKSNKFNNTESLFIIGNGTNSSARDDIFLVNPNTVMIGSATLGSDTFLYVGNPGLLTNTRMDGNLVVSGTLKSFGGFSGSLTKLQTGDDYLIPGAGVTLSTGSNGSITIASTITQTAAGGSDTQVQFNDGGSSFGADSTFTFNKTTDTLNVQNIIIGGDLTVNGTMATVNTTNLEVKDSVIGLGFSAGTISEPANDRGLIMGLGSSDKAAFLWKNTDSEFVLGRTQASATGSLPVTLSSLSNLRLANVQANIITASLGFSGSLTKLTNGNDYLVSGAGITLSTGSNGSVTIASTITQTSPGGSTNYVQYKDGSGAFAGDADFVFDASTTRVGIGTSSPSYTLEVNGSFAATTKSFVINHPSKPGWKLRHGSLEGPENGVYVRGRSKSKEIILPEYWKDLVDENSITVQITPIRSKLDYFISSISVEKIELEFDVEVEYCYLVQASRKDETFEVEFESQ
jgi:hypothetical protein